jgi:NADH:ubiquinone oxidoreductase subunit 6 (subunit J)
VIFIISSNETINAIYVFMLTIIPLGGIVRVILCSIQMQYDEDSEKKLKARIKNAVIFVVVSELLVSLIVILTRYFGG